MSHISLFLFTIYGFTIYHSPRHVDRSTQSVRSGDIPMLLLVYIS